MMFKAVIFDMDGTLINTLGDIADTMNGILLKYGYAPYSHDECRYFIGNGALELVKGAVKGRDQNCGDDRILAMYNDYLAAYAERNNSGAQPYKGICEMIKELSDSAVPLGVVSNKPQIQLSRLTDHFFPNTFVAVEGTENGIPIKPQPDLAVRMAAKWGVLPKETIFVGDSGIDMETAKNANMYGVGVLWGFRDEGELVKAGAKRVISSPGELIDIYNNF